MLLRVVGLISIGQSNRDRCYNERSPSYAAVMQDDHQDHEPPSKSQRKRDAKALQQLGSELVDLNASQLEAIQMPDELREAIELARRIREKTGRKRQLQFIGKLLRQIDAEPLQRQLDASRLQDRGATARLHRLEHWRERLIDEGDEALAELLELYPQADRQHLRQLIRNARQERERQQAPKSARQLFRYLRELDR